MNKYRAQRVGGFGSKLESAVHDLLELRVRAKEIKDLKCQQTVRLTAAEITYRSDFSFVEIASGETVWAEAKGVETERWRIIKKLWAFYGPGRLLIFKGGYGNPKLVEEIISKKKAA